MVKKVVCPRCDERVSVLVWDKPVSLGLAGHVGATPPGATQGEVVVTCPNCEEEFEAVVPLAPPPGVA